MLSPSNLSSSELILNPDKSIYHLNLLPEQLADIVITVGDPDRVSEDLDVDSFIVSEKAIGFDGLIYFYAKGKLNEIDYAESFRNYMKWNSQKANPYVVSANKELLEKFPDNEFIRGTTATNIGFYGPQGRKLRLQLEDENLNQKLQDFRYKENRITNMEMETSGIFALSKMLGHRAISLNAIVANRTQGTFSADSGLTIDKLIKSVLKIIT